MSCRCLRFTILLATLTASFSAVSDSLPADRPASTRFENEFFAEYRPQNALDMVRQVPGFRIDNGGGGRGLGGRPGNVLINGRQPNAKQDSVSSQLQRIPASRVQSIDLIRGGASGLDAASGRPIVDVRLVPGAARAWTWSTTVEQDTDNGGPTPSARIAMVEDRGDLQIRAGLSAGISFFGNRARERLSSGDEITELRDDKERFDQQFIELNLNATRDFGGERLLATYLELNLSDNENFDRSLRTRPDSADVDRRQLGGDTQRTRVELGADYDWRPAPDWSARLIGLFRYDDNADFDVFRFGPDGADPTEIRESDSEALTREAVLRSEWGFSGIQGHELQLDAEVALNSLRNTLNLSIADNGTLVPVVVPGGNTEIEELRVDARLRDRMVLGSLVIEPALGAEHSVIEQLGPGGQERSFTFLKPELNFIQTPRPELSNRFRLERTIAQLDFNQFASSTDFNDDEVDFGNPNLSPQQTWVAEVVHERRFGGVAVISLRAFHHWIDDVQDRLPIFAPGLLPVDVAGNIGDGRRWGLALESTLPLESVGLEAGRLDLNANWEDSRVTDPVTGRDRALSGQRPYRIEAKLRQDLAVQGWAWGLESDYSGPAREFGVDEIIRFQDGVDFEAFVETTRFAGVKLRLLVQNLADRPFGRERLRWALDRATGDPVLLEDRTLKRDRSVLVSVSGTF